jgi:phosphoribosyl 1,2-cyclic phosphate phosphodiesterase
MGHTETMKIIILGSGTSHGIPVVGCGCQVCTSLDERDKRMRSSIFIAGKNGEAALIDAGPEFRLQAVRAGITHLDGILLTHSHADHIHGLDDVRSLCRDNPLPVYGNEPSIAEMKERFSYIWKETQPGGGKPRLTPIIANGEIRAGNLSFTPVPVKHGILDIFGWEIHEDFSPKNSKKSLLYLTDTSAIPQTSLERLTCSSAGQYRIVIIGGLRARPHETHFTFEQAINTALNIGSDEIYLTHICHEHSHREIEEFCENLRKNHPICIGREEKTIIHPAWDGLELNL